MNRTFTTVAIQSVIAAAVMAAASTAGAAVSARDLGGLSDYARFETQHSERFVSTKSRDQVRAEALAAVRQGLTTSYEGQAQALWADVRSASTLDREQIRAQAREAVRLGLTPGYEHEAQTAAGAGHHNAVRVAAVSSTTAQQ